MQSNDTHEKAAATTDRTRKEDRSPLVKIGALWEGTDSRGKPCFTGELNRSTRLLVLYNHHKEHDGQPAYFVFVAEKNVDRDEQGRRKGYSDEELDKSIPF